MKPCLPPTPVHATQVLLLRESGISQVGAFNLPRLLHADLSGNRIKDLKQLVRFVSRATEIAYVNVLGNPVCNSSSWKQSRDPLPSKKVS